MGIIVGVVDSEKAEIVVHEVEEISVGEGKRRQERRLSDFLQKDCR